MNAIRHPDLAAVVFALALCATFGALFAFVLEVPFWLGFAMVGSALFALGISPSSAPAAALRRPRPRRGALLESVGRGSRA